MQQSPSWKGNSLSVSEEMSRILWNLKVNFLHNNLPSVPILS